VSCCTCVTDPGNGYYLAANGVCTACPTGCSTCSLVSGSVVCTACISVSGSGYYLSNGACLTCSTTNQYCTAYSSTAAALTQNGGSVLICACATCNSVPATAAFLTGGFC
jgi:hypothetical protein